MNRTWLLVGLLVGLSAAQAVEWGPKRVVRLTREQGWSVARGEAAPAAESDVVLQDRWLVARREAGIVAVDIEFDALETPPADGYAGRAEIVNHGVYVVRDAEGRFAKLWLGGNFLMGWAGEDKYTAYDATVASADAPAPPPAARPAPADDPAPAGEPAPGPGSDAPAAQPALVPAPFARAGQAVGAMERVTLPFRPDDFLLLPDHTAYMWNALERKLHRVRLSDGQVLSSGDTGLVLTAGLAYNPANGIVYRIDIDGGIEAFAAATSQPLGQGAVPRRHWTDLPTLVGAIADPVGGRVLAIGSEQLWTIEADGTMRGPVDLPVGPGGTLARGLAVRGRTLWVLGAPWEASPPVAVPVDLERLTPGEPVVLATLGASDYVSGFAMDVAPDGRSFYVTGAQETLFLAEVRPGAAPRRVELPLGLFAPNLAVSPDGGWLVLWRPGTSGKWSERVTEHSTPGGLALVRTVDLRPVLELGRDVREVIRGQWWVADIGSPEWAAFSSDGAWLFVGDARRHEVLITRLR